MTASQGAASQPVLDPPKRSGLQRFLDELGPGLITGAADDDPSASPHIPSQGHPLATRLFGQLSFPFRSWQRFN